MDMNVDIKLNHKAYSKVRSKSVMLSACSSVSYRNREVS